MRSPPHKPDKLENGSMNIVADLFLRTGIRLTAAPAGVVERDGRGISVPEVQAALSLDMANERGAG